MVGGDYPYHTLLRPSPCFVNTNVFNAPLPLVITWKWQSTLTG